MQPRINITSVSPGAFKAMLGLETYLRESGLDAKLLDLWCSRGSASRVSF